MNNILTVAFSKRYRAFSHTSNKIKLYAATSSLNTSLKNQPSISNNPNVFDQVTTAGIASAAVIAATAVNAAVSMRTLSAPDSERSFVYKDSASSDRIGKVDEYGLPLVYDKDLIQSYWAKQGSALTQRWTEFLGYAIPFLTRIITITVSGGSEELKRNGASLAKDARVIFEKLGPTYVKLGQMMSVRPDVLPKEALEELKILQDSVKPFDTVTAIKQIESELGGKLEEFFSEISVEPVAAASLAQVYKAKLASTGEYVAVKVQRPNILQVVSKDLYVLRRAAEVYQGLMDRFAPQQRTNYVALLNEWAIGFYTELDFLNEAANQQKLKDLMIQENVSGIYIPKVVHSLCTRRILVSEWIDGKKLSECEPVLLRSLIPDAQEAFLTQLLQVGVFHSDPHPGNIFYMNTPRGNAKLALLDFGLVAAVKQEDMDTMVSAIIHLANRDYTNLVDDFINLKILPQDCDRQKVIPLMDKALTPYVKGGGAQKYEEELKKMYGMDGSLSGTTGGFQQMTQDALTVLNDIPFSIPPYFALLARAIVTLEGIALTGDPSYGIIMESYPFVARKLLKEDRPEIQRALQQVLYGSKADHNDNANGLQANRLSVLLNSALGIVKKSSDSFIDIDTIPEGSIDLKTAFKFILSPSASSLRNILIQEGVTALDILTRQGVRKSYSQIVSKLPKPPLPSFMMSLIAKPTEIKVPFFIPKYNIVNEENNNNVEESENIKLSNNLADYKQIRMTTDEFVDISCPKLSREEELYALSLTDLAIQSFGNDAGVIVNGNVLLDPSASTRFVLDVLSTGKIPFLNMKDSGLSQKQVSDFINRFLKPLLLNERSTPRRNSLSLQRFSEEKNEVISNSSINGMDDLKDAFSSLSDEEELILQQLTQEIVTKTVLKALKRLQ
eukprot:gene5416-7504_t